MTLATRQGMLSNLDGGRFSYVNTVALDGDDDSSRFSLPRGAKAMSMQAVGTFDSGTIALQCSNDGTTYAALPTAVSHTVAGIKSVAAIDLGFRYYKLLVSGGGGSCALFGHVHILCDG